MKTLLKYFIIILFLYSQSEMAIAQLDVNINGVGRGILSNNQLSGPVLHGDTASPRKGLSGYFLFDMSMSASKGTELRTNVVLRLKQPWGEFYGETTPFEFRQFQVMGDLRWLHYELGDIDLEQTSYTVFNNNEMYHQFEADPFKARRQIVEYENFNKGNVWRLQGVKLGTVAYIDKSWLKEVQIKSYGVRTNTTNDANTPDRILAGGTIKSIISEGHTIGFNYSGLLDVPLDGYTTNYRNNVGTLDINHRLVNQSNFKLFLTGEGGLSSNKYYKSSIDSTREHIGYFYDVSLKAQAKKGLGLKVGYKNVGLWFTSPASQTLRVNVNQPTMLFTNIYNNTTPRPQMMYDRFTQEQIYNRTLSPILQSYVPYYGNISPYGDATPNRQGLTLALASAPEKEKFEFNVTAKAMTEVQAIGSTELRHFIGAYSGCRIGLDSILGMTRKFKMTFGAQYESTNRSQGNINLKTMIGDGGITYNILRSCDFMFGVKVLNANGHEVMPIRNTIGDIITYQDVYVKNHIETIYSTGFKLIFNEYTNFYVNYNLVSTQDKQTVNAAYNLNQLFMNFNLTF
jgi:hypothetical protein